MVGFIIQLTSKLKASPAVVYFHSLSSHVESKIEITGSSSSSNRLSNSHFATVTFHKWKATIHSSSIKKLFPARLFISLFKLFFFFFLCLSFCPIFSLCSFFFPLLFLSSSLLRSLPLFSVLSLFSIARKKEITWVEHGVVWIDGEAPIWAWVCSAWFGLTERRRSGLGCARRGLGWRSRRRSGCGFARCGLGLTERRRSGCRLSRSRCGAGAVVWTFLAHWWVELTVPINIHFDDVCFLRQSSLEFVDGFVPIFTPVWFLRWSTNHFCFGSIFP